MMEVKEGQTAAALGAVPPFVTFRWGRETTFKSVCTSLTVAFKLFRPNGDPIRADVKMTLKQAETAGTASANGANRAGNPTTRANAGHGVHTVKDGDTLPSIAYRRLRRRDRLARDRRRQRDREPAAPAPRPPAHLPKLDG